MDLNQQKLTRSEWNNIEVPLSFEEKNIIELIIQGFHNVNITINNNFSLLRYLKISCNNNIINYIYNKYLYSDLLELSKKYNFKIDKVNDKKLSIKKADLIRFENTDKQLNDNKNDIFEYFIIDLLSNMFKNLEKNNKKWLYYFYTIKVTINYNIPDINLVFKEVILDILSNYEHKINLRELIEISDELIEKNPSIIKYDDLKLYEHQKKLFTICKNSNSKLILYIAPTGTGKTLSPIGLSEKYKIIFVCAARHVGLALAKAAIAVQKRIGFAFGCQDAEDVRLHYYAVKDCIRSKKTGSIVKVDNSVGDKVEIMICDIKSYIHAMHYMLAFNNKENIILYWDEPTITLDYSKHEFHEIINNNWKNNLIPNVVLSSATLPHPEELTDTLQDFRSRFNDCDIHTIISYDCKKTIPLINKEGYVEMPHYLSSDFNETKEIIEHCNKYKTLMRYLDLSEIIKYILYVNNNNLIENKYKIERYFHSFEMITMKNIKLYYLILLNQINKETWDNIYKNLYNSRNIKYNSTINCVTKDAITLTDGPTIFLAEDINKIAKFCIQLANIPNMVIKDIMSAIEYNQVINSKILPLEKTVQDALNKDSDKEKKISDGRVDPTIKTLMGKIDELRQCIKTIALNPIFVPNTVEHNKRFHGCINNRSFSSDISENIIEKIMLINDIENYWKLLLMMGIGVFTSHKNDKYTEIMKSLAEEQKLYLIIASDDYIYGTNYQFCHGYISKDLGHISQEKCIQAMGRVGRNKFQQDYSIRFRDNDLIKKLFTKEINKPEVKNMCELFNS
jgi:predicted nucleic acid-binding protein